MIIRTLLIRDNHYEFQVGGGIIYDSKPLSEWQEILTKALPLLTILGLSEKAFLAL
mgnify:CR=1 FL=1